MRTRQESWAKWRYGLSADDRAALHAKQAGKCAMCETAIPVAGRRVHVDHDHETGVVRGLLCHRCNQGLSYVERPEFLQRALDYLRLDRAVHAL